MKPLLRNIVLIFRRVALAFFDVMNPPIPGRIARWVPGFLKATPQEVARYEQWRARLKGDEPDGSEPTNA